jgi:hypothetical protein
MSKTKRYITDELNYLERMLHNKNDKYGDSAIAPVRIFSKASPEEQLNVRMDDKLSRIASGQTDDDEDAELDLIGYLIIKRVQRRIKGEEHVTVRNSFESSRCH